MRVSLKPHPLEAPPAVVIDVAIERTKPGALSLHYQLRGPMAELIVPAAAELERADELWRHTCFEAFVGAAHETAYCEFNFAPSRRWAAYRFISTRAGMAAAPINAPRIEVSASDNGIELRAALDLSGAGLPLDAPWRVGLSAVVEERDGSRSYWALAHPTEQPDFHHAESFVLELPAVEPV